MNKIACASQNTETKTLPADICVFGQFVRISPVAVKSQFDIQNIVEDIRYISLKINNNNNKIWMTFRIGFKIGYTYSRESCSPLYCFYLNIHTHTLTRWQTLELKFIFPRLHFKKEFQQLPISHVPWDSNEKNQLKWLIISKI